MITTKSATFDVAILDSLVILSQKQTIEISPICLPETNDRWPSKFAVSLYSVVEVNKPSREFRLSDLAA